MSLTLSNLKPAKGSVKRRKKVGRGGKRGTYSGRGIKGQKSRSGGKSGLKAMGFKQTLQRIPKSRGFKSLKPKMEVINLSDLELKFNDGDKVTVNALIRADLISGSKAGVKLIVVANAFSESAKDAIISAGGKIEII